MASTSTTESHVTETFLDSESDDELDTDSAGDFDIESDSEDEERIWSDESFKPKTFTLTQVDLVSIHIYQRMMKIDHWIIFI